MIGCRAAAMYTQGMDCVKAPSAPKNMKYFHLLSTFQTTTPLNQYRLYTIFHENNNMKQWIKTIYCKGTKCTKKKL